MSLELQNTRKKLDSRTQSFGGDGQYEGGLRERCGQAKFHKHKWTYVTKYKSGYSSKNMSAKGRKEKMNAMTVDLLDEITDQPSTKRENDKFFNVIENLDYTMLVYAYKPAKSFVEKTPFCLELADEKTEFGGQILVGNEKLESGG